MEKPGSSPPLAPRRVGYVIPEFPGQTHIFFRREMHALEALGFEAQVVSTRRPPSSTISHTWARAAMEETFYLFPPRPRDIVVSGVELARAGPRGWLRCARSILQAKVGLGQRLRLVAFVAFGARVAGLARERGWEHLQVHSCADSANIALFASLLSGIGYAVTLHGPLEYFGPNQEQKWRHADFAIVVTRRLLEEVREQLGPHLPDRIEVAPMGVDAIRFRRARPYGCWAGEGSARIFSCGRLSFGKGHHDLIRALGILRDAGLNAELVVAGADDPAGRNRQRLEVLVSELGLQDHVELLGAVSEEEVRSQIEEAHVFALASHEEAIGVATMEAMAMETPVVVTGVGGVPELIDDGIDGILVEPKNPQGLAGGIRRVLSDPALARRLSSASRPKIERRFHSGVSAEAIAACLDAQPARRPAR